MPSGGHHFPPLSGPEQATDFLSLTPPLNTAANCTAQTRWNWFVAMNAGKILAAGSQWTLRWRDMDSNFWYRGTKAVDFRSIPGIAGVSAGLLNDTT